MSPPTWYASPRASVVERAQVGVVDLWRVSLDADTVVVDVYGALLNDAELEQAARFRFDSKRREFVITRGLLRRVLARAVMSDGDDACAKSLALRAGNHGKPVIYGPGECRAIRFNVSHTRGLALIALTREREVGVDIEHIGRVKDYLRLAERFFSPCEYQSLIAMPEASRQRAFFTCWTRKEAYLKAIGAGITLGLDRFDVTVSPDEAARLIETRHDAREAARWELMNVDAGQEYAGTLAVERGDVSLRQWDATG